MRVEDMHRIIPVDVLTELIVAGKHNNRTETH